MPRRHGGQLVRWVTKRLHLEPRWNRPYPARRASAGAMEYLTYLQRRTPSQGVFPMANADLRARRDVTVAVVREKGAPFQIERASIEAAPRPEEVIVRMVATGVCHTDLLVRDQDYSTPLP